MRIASMRPGRLVRDCPTPYPGGSCGCGCGCTSPTEAAREDELDALMNEKSEAATRLRAAEQGLEAWFRRGAK
jgi:hypothetical protein